MFHPNRRIFSYLILIQFVFSALIIATSFANRTIQVFVNPASGVAPLEVELLCIVAGDTSSPTSYIIDFGDGSDPEKVESTAYSHTFTHTYQGGLFKPVCTVLKSLGLRTDSDPGQLVVARWQFETAGDIDTAPAIGSDGTLYVGSDDGNLYAINPDTGAEIWRFPLGSAILSSPTIGIDGSIYFGSLNSLYAVKSNGTLRWSFNVGDFIFSSPAVSPDGRLIYVGSSNGSLYAISANGTIKWQFQTGGKITSSPAIGHDGVEEVVYVGSQDRHVYAIAADNGALKWDFETRAEVYGSPAIGTDGTVYVGACTTGSAAVYDFNLFRINVDGSKRWEFDGGAGFYSSPAIGSDDTIYVGSWDGYLLAINSGGTLSWSVRTSPPADINSSPAVGANNLVYVGCKDGNFYAFQSPAVTDENERKAWVFQTGDIIRSSPVIDSDGTIYFGSRNNNLYAINPGGLTPANSAWPMFQKNAARTGVADNITIPTVISSSPERSTTDVDIQLESIEVNFSPLVESSQVDIDSFILEKETESGREIVEGYAVLDNQHYNNSGYHNVAVYNLKNDTGSLEYNTVYYGIIRYSEEVGTDEAGTGSYDETYTWTFTTETKPDKDGGAGDGGDPTCFIGTIFD